MRSKHVKLTLCKLFVLAGIAVSLTGCGNESNTVYEEDIQPDTVVNDSTNQDEPIVTTENESDNTADGETQVTEDNTEESTETNPDEATELSGKPNIIFIFTDDHGYADVGIQNQVTDVLTPNIDKLAQGGITFSNGYVTAPQCTPSRAALMTGIYQQRFGLDENENGPLSVKIPTIANHFKQLGYTTGMAGKWHLEINNRSHEWAKINAPNLKPFKESSLPIEVRSQYYPDKKGFDSVNMGYTKWFWSNVDQDGGPIPPGYRVNDQYRIDIVTQSASSFIRNNHDKPFMLYLAPYGPHVPLEAIESDLKHFPENLPNRRRHALAMLYAIDRGVGTIVNDLEELNLLENTLIFFISDNGAPLGDTMEDSPLTEYGVWDGSLNFPLTGEKGMLSEGGIKVPFIAFWAGKLNGGSKIDAPVSTLDAVYTSLKASGATDELLAELSGADLLPIMQGEDTDIFVERPLYWRFYKQRAVRQGPWKYLQAGVQREYLFNLDDDPEEKYNLIKMYPETAKKLKQLYISWDSQNLRNDPYHELTAPFARRYDDYMPAYYPSWEMSN